MNKREILYLCYRPAPHSAHRFGAEILNADIKPLLANAFIIPTRFYQLTISEGFRPFIIGSIMKRTKLTGKHINIILGDFALNAIFTNNARSMQSKLALLLFKLLYNCDGFIANSTFTAEIIKNLFNIDCKRIKSVTPRAYIKPFLNLKLKEEGDVRYPNICYLGHLTYLDGADLLPEIFRKIRSEMKDSKFFVIGKGPLYPELLRAKKSLEGFHILGYRSYTHVREVFSKCLVFIYPARVKMFGLPIMQAMSAGLIPVITRTTGARDIVKQCDPSLIVSTDAEEIAKRVIQLLSASTERLTLLSRKSREIALEVYKKTPREFLVAVKDLLAT